MLTRAPNLMLLIGEDVGRHQGCYGDAFARTPSLDRLAAEGCRFSNAYTTAPVCSPARSTIITGQDPRKLGTHLHRSELCRPPHPFTEALRDGGYYVNWANKTDFNFDEQAEGFLQRLADARTDWRPDLANGRLPNQPWMFFFNFAMTHESQLWPPNAVANEPAEDPGAHDAGLDNLPGLEVPPYLPDTRTTRASLVRYYDRLAEQDRQIGQVLDDLERSGQAENTIVVYLSDHGRGLVREKRWCYPAGVRMPLIVRAPGLLQAGSTRDDLVSWVDIAPTLLALAGIERPTEYDGRAFLGDAMDDGPACVFFGRDRMDSSHDRVRGAADRRYLYLVNDRPEIPYAQCNRYMETSPVTAEMRRLYHQGQLTPAVQSWFDLTKPSEELYDLGKDPHAMSNLSGRSAYAGKLQELRDAVREWRGRINDQGLRPEIDLIDEGLIRDDRVGLAQRKGVIPIELDPHGAYATRLNVEAT